MTLNVVDLFAGAGGLSLGFKQAGFKLLAAVEASKHHAETYQQNLKEVKMHQCDIQDVYAESFMGVADVVIGSPPYDAFIATNKQRRADPAERLYEDPHGLLVLDFIDFLAAARPKAFLLELCPDFAEEATMQSLAEELGKAGFPEAHVAMLNAADFGATTDRMSLFITNVPLEPAPPEELGLPVGAHVEAVPEGLQNHDMEKLSDARLEQIAKMDMGEFLEELPLGDTGEFYPNWFRLIPEATSPPLYGFTRFVHPFEDRLCTVRECARLMGFPDKYVFGGNHNAQYEAVGNAVPPPLARAVATELGIALTQTERRAHVA